MRFKTVIKLTSDAQDKGEALELVEEYLAGNIVSGVDMKCVTKPVYSKVKIAGVAALSLAIAVGIFVISYVKQPQNVLPTISGVDAVQPLLKTSNIAQKSLGFKKDWQDRQTKEALEQIRR
jgi:hypothetical protein